ncbi:Uncharacterized protein APZ42_001815 [Daphnia magna]|uniref:Uncharacterized protein n=1 Tax=Daphnia magna TaxID=35525 RepID=A0A164IQE3_9CRUS|nr:Uncharacterized protein APZ42_001815 [Daphnia magna]
MAITNLSDHKQWIEEGKVLGIIKPVTEIKEGDMPVAVATAGAEKKALWEHGFESRIGEGLMPTDRGSTGAEARRIEPQRSNLIAGGKDIRDREAEFRETIPLGEEVQEARNERMDNQVSRSTQARMPPVRYGQMPQAAVGALLQLLELLGPLMGVQPSQGHSQEAFSRDGVIFQLQGEVFFSDSEWVVVTDVSFGPIENALNKLHLWFTDSAKKKESQAEETT